MDAKDPNTPSSSDLNAEYRKLLDAIPHPDISKIPESEVRYRQNKTTYMRQIMDANGNMIPHVDICFHEPIPYTVHFSVKNRVKKARKILFGQALGMLAAGADLSIKNGQGKPFLQLFTEYWPWVPYELEGDPLRAYLLPHASQPEVRDFVKEYEHRSKMANIRLVVSGVLIGGILVASFSPLWLRFAIPAAAVVWGAARFLVVSPFYFPPIGLAIGAFLTYGGIMTLRGGKKNDGTPIKPYVKAIKKTLTLVFAAYTALCLVNSIRSCGPNGRPINESPIKINERRMESKPAGKPVFALRARQLPKASPEKKAFSCSREMYKYASRLTEQRISGASRKAFQNRTPIIQRKLPARC